MIYFLQDPNGGPVKIGCTLDVPRRHRQLEIHYGRKLVLLATMEGDESVERSIHERFAHLRLPGSERYNRVLEQFRPAPELMAFIGRPPMEGEDPESVEPMRLAGFNPNRSYRKVMIDSRLAGMVKTIAKHRGVTAADLLSDLLEGPVSRAFGLYMEHLADESGLELACTSTREEQP